MRSIFHRVGCIPSTLPPPICTIEPRDEIFNIARCLAVPQCPRFGIVFPIRGPAGAAGSKQRRQIGEASRLPFCRRCLPPLRSTNVKVACRLYTLPLFKHTLCGVVFPSASTGWIVGDGKRKHYYRVSRRPESWWTMQLRDSKRERRDKELFGVVTWKRSARFFFLPCCKLKQVRACVGLDSAIAFVQNRTVQVVKCSDDHECG